MMLMQKTSLGYQPRSESSIQAWSTASFQVERVGLLQEHVSQYNLPDNPERPGEYQWEALPDESARELIENALNTYVDLEAIRKIEEEEEQATERWNAFLDGAK
jgi:hypothetical protein